MGTVLIKNVKIIGGENDGDGESTCVFISGEKISAIGNFPNKPADEIIDGQGAYLSSGFIDAHNDSDHYLTIFENPLQENFLKQGITTIICGQCGSSLAPLLYGELDSMRKWADTNKINVSWHGMGELLEVLEKKRLGVNFATLAGHSTIRHALVGESLRSLTKNELVVFGRVLNESLGEGGFGLSTGLEYVHGRQTPCLELKFLAEIVKNFSGVYATHLRKTGNGLLESVREALSLARETGVKTIISHFLPRIGQEKEYEEALKEISALPENADFHFDVFPFGTSAVPIYTFLPLWAQTGNLKKMKADIEDEWFSKKVLKELPAIDPADFVVASSFQNDSFVGKTLQDVMLAYEARDWRKALLKLMAATSLRAVVFQKNINKDELMAALKHPRSLVATNAAGSSESLFMLESERGTSTFTKFLALAEKENLMPLKEAVLKITKAPARKFNFQKRGEVKEGFFADLVIFRNAEVKSVLVNGQIALKNGEMRNVLAGKALRHHAP